MTGRSYQIAARAVLAALFAVCVYRAITQSITHDEALTYKFYIVGPISDIFHRFDPCHHFVNTVLIRLSTGLFGVSELSMRLPALAGAAPLSRRTLSTLSIGFRRRRIVPAGRVAAFPESVRARFHGGRARIRIGSRAVDLGVDVAHRRILPCRSSAEGTS